MTGEMLQIDPITGREPDGTVWPLHAAIAQAVGGELRPFDQYQGPYVLIGPDYVIGQDIYSYLPPGSALRLWIVSRNGVFGRVYREDTAGLSGPFLLTDHQAGIDAALRLLEEPVELKECSCRGDGQPSTCFGCQDGDNRGAGTAIGKAGSVGEAVGYALATGQGQFICDSRGVEIFDTPSEALAEFDHIEEQFGIDGDAVLYGLIPIAWPSKGD